MRVIFLAGCLGLVGGPLLGSPCAPSPDPSDRVALPEFGDFLGKQQGLTRPAFFARYVPRPGVPDSLGIELEKVQYFDLIQRRIKPTSRNLRRPWAG
jgi:hypothetical protein